MFRGHNLGGHLVKLRPAETRAWGGKNVLLGAAEIQR